MDADEILFIATLAAIFPYLAVATGDWVIRRKHNQRNHGNRSGADAPR